MLPTLNLTSTLVLAERLSPRFNKVGTGDVVIVRSPVFPRKVVTKRVLGVEGDRVTYVVDPKNSDKSETVVVLFIWLKFWFQICIALMGFWRLCEGLST